MAEGIRKRHSRACPAQTGGKCRCSPTWQARVWDPDARRHITTSKPSEAEAKAWRRDIASAVGRQEVKAPTKDTFATAARQLISDMRGDRPKVRKNASKGDPYKPSVIEAYSASLEQWIIPKIGLKKLSAVTVDDLQGIADTLRDKGKTASTISNVMMPVRVLYRRHARTVPTNPTRGLELEPVKSRRERVADALEADALLAVLPDWDRALWATLFYTGVRIGEARALDWEHVDFDLKTIRVEWSWCNRTNQRVRPKSRAGVRTVPILPGMLRGELLAHWLRAGRPTSGFVFARPDGAPLDHSVVTRRATRIWKAEKLSGITPHEARHSFASYAIAAGLNMKTVSVFMGHSSILVTADLYGHLFPGAEDVAAEQMDAWFAARRAAALDKSLDAQTADTL